MSWPAARSRHQVADATAGLLAACQVELALQSECRENDRFALGLPPGGQILGKPFGKSRRHARHPIEVVALKLLEVASS